MQHEQSDLQQQIQEILEENHSITSKLDVLKSNTKASLTATTAASALIQNQCLVNDSRDDATREKLASDTHKNLRKQIDYLHAENRDLRALHKNCQKTIDNLEKEIQNYRNQLFQPASVCEVKQRYTTAIKLLESTIINQKAELKEQTQIVESLLEQKKDLREQVEKLEKSLEAKENDLQKIPEINETIIGLQEQLNEAVNHNKELQKSVKLSKAAIEERFKREQNALQKVQEALTIAETAVADKDDALKREKLLKEECDNIANTIGQVMDEAARKVEKDMEVMRRKYVDKEKVLLDEKAKLVDEIQNHKKFNQILDTRSNRFEHKYKDAMKDNERLSQQLELAAKTLYEMEQRLNVNTNVQKDEEKIKKRLEDQENEIRQYVETNKQLKEKYRVALNEVTNEFKKEIYRLQSEVATLKAENQLIRVRKTYDDHIDDIYEEEMERV